MSLIRSFDQTFYLFQCVESTGPHGLVWRARVPGDESQAARGRSAENKQGDLNLIIKIS